MELKNGTLLCNGKYRIVRFLNSGGFGCTYEGVHVALNKRIAIKEFFIEDFCNRDKYTGGVTVGSESKIEFIDKLRKRFIKEAQVISSFEHDGIVRVSDVFEENGTAYYIMNFIDGFSLKDILKKNGKILENEAIGYINQVCNALSYIHLRNHLHLDIKPDNIMIDKLGKAVLIDFGTSKQLMDDGFGGKTSTTFGLTPGYAPPEQCSGESKLYSPASDIYALGATLCHLLTGIIPPNVNQRVCGTALPSLPNNVSQSTRDAIESSMRLNNTERPQSIREFLDIITAQTDEEPSNETTVRNPIDSTKTEKVTAPFSNQPKDTFIPKPHNNPSKISSVPPSKRGVKRRLPKWLHPAYGLVVITLIIIGLITFSQYSTGGRNSDCDSIAAAKDEDPEPHLDLYMDYDSGKIGYKDDSGKYVIPAQFDEARDFSEGLAAVKLNDKYGYIDKNGKFVISAQFNGAGDFSEGLACVNQDGKLGFIDKTGKFVIPAQFDTECAMGLYAGGGFSEGLASVAKNGKFGYIDKTGKFVIPAQFELVMGFSEGLAPVAKNGKFGYIDKTGKFVIPAQFNGARPFSEGLASVNQNLECGYIDKTGKIVIPVKFEWSWDFSEGLAPAQLKNGKRGYIDKTGKFVIQPQFSDAHEFTEGLARVMQNDGNEFYIDKKGRRYSTRAEGKAALAKEDK